MKRIDNGETAMNEPGVFFSEIIGIKLDARNLYNVYSALQGRKDETAPIVLDKIHERLNLRMQRDDEKSESDDSNLNNVDGVSIRIIYNLQLPILQITRKILHLYRAI